MWLITRKIDPGRAAGKRRERESVGALPNRDLRLTASCSSCGRRHGRLRNSLMADRWRTDRSTCRRQHHAGGRHPHHRAALARLLAKLIAGGGRRAIAARSRRSRSSRATRRPAFGETFRIMSALPDVAPPSCGSLLLQTGRAAGGAARRHDAGARRTPELRIKIVPILGGAFGGNYSYIIWDGAAPAVGGKRPCIVVDPADPFPVYVASRAEGLQIEVCLCSHWHFDHAGGNRALARRVPGLQVVGGAGDFARTPAATRQVRDLEELTLGRIWMRAHAVPGHTRGSVVWEVGTSADADAPTAAFTGDTSSAAAAARSSSRRPTSCTTVRQTGRGCAATASSTRGTSTPRCCCGVVRREPFNLAARKALKQAELPRAQAADGADDVEQELTYNFHLRCTKEGLADWRLRARVVYVEYLSYKQGAQYTTARATDYGGDNDNKEIVGANAQTWEDEGAARGHVRGRRRAERVERARAGVADQVARRRLDGEGPDGEDEAGRRGARRHRRRPTRRRRPPRARAAPQFRRGRGRGARRAGAACRPAGGSARPRARRTPASWRRLRRRDDAGIRGDHHPAARWMFSRWLPIDGDGEGDEEKRATS